VHDIWRYINVLTDSLIKIQRRKLDEW